MDLLANWQRRKRESTQRIKLEIGRRIVELKGQLTLLLSSVHVLLLLSNKR